MALYAIGDLHLSFSSDKPMDVFGGGWVNYVDKLTESFKVLREDDVCVLCGDISWAMSLDECRKDFEYIDRLPGKKIILKGNHDYWWNTVSKMKRFLAENNFTSIDFLHNNCFLYGSAAICGTRGWQNDESMSASENAKIIAREAMRLRSSLQASKDMAPGDDINRICFLHFPPRFGNTVCREIVSVMEEFGVKECRYGHLHGQGHRYAIQGFIDGINYDIISADYVDFVPQKVV